MTEVPHPFAVAANEVDPPTPPVVERFWSDPAGFARQAIRWEPGEGPAAYQATALSELQSFGREAVRGPHGLGKTAMASWAVLWFATTRDAAGTDWKVVTTASAWRQLTHYLWPEIRTWAGRLDFGLLGHEEFGRRDLKQLSLSLEHGEAFAVACDDPDTIEGAHASQLLYVFDEAKAIPGATFDAAEGAFSQAGADTDADAFALAISTPGAPAGRFYDIHSQKAGLEDWHTRYVTRQEAIDAGRMSAQWAAQRRRQWGATSAVYLNRVEGKFAASDEDAVVPLSWVEDAQQRWLDAHPDCTWEPDGHTADCDMPPLTSVGVDVARHGVDDTVLALLHGLTVAELRHTSGEDTEATAGRVSGVLDTRGGVPVVDVIGIGAGVVDKLRSQSRPTVAFNASRGTDLRDASGELGFTNCRSAAWWNLRTLLDPSRGAQLELPPDDRLVGDLTAPTWRVVAGGRIQVESKDELRRRLGRSTDDADAVMMALWALVQPAAPEEVRDVGERVEISPI